MTNIQTEILICPAHIFERVEQEIRSEFDSILSHVAKRRDQLLANLNEVREEHLRREETRVKKFKELENMIEILSDLSLHLTDTVDLQRTHIDKTKKEISKYERPTPCPVPVFRKEGFQSCMLQLEWIGTVQDEVELYSDKINPFKTIGKSDSKKRQLKGPAGVCLDAEGRVYVCDSGNSRIQVFSKEGKFLTEFGKEHFTEPHGVEIHNKLVFVSDCRQNSIFKLQIPDYKLLKESVVGVIDNPRGLTVDKNNNEILVADSNNHRIAVFNLDLMLVREIGKGVIERPRDVKIHSNRIFVAVKSSGDNVYIFTKATGELVNKIISLQEGYSDIFFCFDKMDNIVLSDRISRTLQVFTKDGHILHCIQCEGETTGVAVTNDNTLLCAIFSTNLVQFF